MRTDEETIFSCNCRVVSRDSKGSGDICEGGKLPVNSPLVWASHLGILILDCALSVYRGRLGCVSRGSSGGAFLSGTNTEIFVPLPLALSSFKTPSTRVARSRMLTIPKLPR